MSQSSSSDTASPGAEPGDSSPRDKRQSDTNLFDALTDWLKTKFRRSEDVTLRDILQEVIEEHSDSEALLNPQERLMLMNLAKLRELSVSDVMVPRADVIAVDVGTPFADVVKLFGEAAHSRLPLYRKNLDGVIGMLHIKDVFQVQSDMTPDHPPPKIEALRRDILFVPPSMPVVDLLIKMRATRIHMAMVVDEYGGIDGLATIEDLVEQFVGDIEDEHDVIEPEPLRKVAEGEIDADARGSVEALEEMIGRKVLIEARDEDIETIGGLVVAIAGRVPQRGEVISHPGGLEFEVMDADPRRLKKLKIRFAPPPSAEA
ncbi:MAG TPA: hemolysin family protein [Alphaproteobacteria bacterium]|nr:hemolysin family protein [Alphaproteobacteria bacterium]